jgi:RNA polymerase sigma-70 factor (ECF subfamily)
MELDDNVLIRQCLNGDINAFENLVDKYQKQILNVAYRMIHDFDEAEDIAQSVFIRAYENLKAFNPKYKFFSWIYRIAVNESLNYLNKKSRKEELNKNLITKEKTLDQIVDGIELSEKIQDALIVLDLNYRVVIVLNHFMDFSYKEISDILEIQEKTVKSRLFTARQLLKDILIKNKAL